MGSFEAGDVACFDRQQGERLIWCCVDFTSIEQTNTNKPRPVGKEDLVTEGQTSSKGLVKTWKSKM